MTNSLRIIHPYKDEGIWMFDDESVGLVREPFVGGTERILDAVVHGLCLADAENGMTMIFSDQNFPGSNAEWIWEEGDNFDGGGNWYRLKPTGMMGWLCPALFKYFDKAPKNIYLEFREREGDRDFSS